jgi:hypothetical protein
MSLEALSRVMQEFFGSITALLYDTAHYPHAINPKLSTRAGKHCAPRNRAKGDSLEVAGSATLWL